MHFEYRFPGRSRRCSVSASGIRWLLLVTITAKGALGQSNSDTVEPGTNPSVTNQVAANPDVPADTQPAPIEVTVQGESRPAGTTSISRSEARNLPGAFGDPFRAVEAQPGVTPVVSGLPYFFLRGAPPGNVGYLIDGIRVPMLYHAFAGPAVVHPALIERTTVYRGAYPASIGRFAGGVVEAETQRPSSVGRAELGVRLFDAGAMLSTPFANGRGNVALGGRYSYTALLLSMLLLDGTRLEYWDYQTRADYDLRKGGIVTLLAFGAHDLSGSTRDNSVFSMDFHRVNVRHELSMGERTRLLTGLTFGTDRTRTSEDSSLSSWSVGGRVQLTQRVSTNATAVVGADFWQENYRSSLTPALKLERLTGTGNELSTGLFIELPWYPTTRVSVTPGVRVDYFGSASHASAVGVDPRISARFKLTEALQLAHSLGVAHQRPTFMPAALPAFQAVGNGSQLQRSLQASSGVELHTGLDTTLSLTAFDNIFMHVTDPLGTTGEVNPNSAQNSALGHAYGLELYLRRPITKGWGGYLSYTLSRSTRAHERIATLSAYDRPHVASAALSYDLGRHWRAGARVMAMSGVPTRTATTEGPIFDGSNRAPAYYRLDTRVEKRWLLSETAWCALVFEVLNATASTEVVRRTCNDRRCQESLFGPVVLPSIGVEAAF